MTASAPVRVFVVVNTANADARPVARSVVEALVESGAHISGVTEDIEALDMTSTSGIELLPSDLAADPSGGRVGTDVVVVFGGDGTILRAAELAEPEHRCSGSISAMSVFSPRRNPRTSRSSLSR